MLLAASRFYTAQQKRALATILATRAEWGKLSKPGDIDKIITRLTAIITAAQLGAAKDGAAYTPAALEEQGFDGASQLRVNPAAFAAGWATSPGNPGLARPMESILGLIPGHAVGLGGSVEQQMANGQRFLDIIARSQVSMAGQMATGAGIASRVKVGYYRHVNPPCCKDCAIQAGKFFRHNVGFARHPHCDCVHVPSYEDSPPAGYTDQPTLDQITGLTDVERKAITDGASLSMVVNARRGASGMFTLESTTKRGYARYLTRAIARNQGEPFREVVATARTGKPRNVTRQAKARLTPEGIYTLARNQEEVILGLIKHGYVIGDIDKLAKTAVAEMRRISALA